MQPLQICIGPIIRIGRESWCLPYAGFFVTVKAFPADTPSIASGNKLPEQLMSHVSTKNIYTGTLSATIHSRFVVC